MQYRQLGNSGLKLSVLTLGTMTFGGEGVMAKVGNVDAAGVRVMVDKAFDAGVNAFDTANVYSHGVAEKLLGKALKGKRQQAVVASKVCFPMGQGVNDRGLSRVHIREQVEASLRRLDTDYIDLYQMHGWDGVTPVEETLATFDTLVHEGKIRYYGLSNFSAWHVMKMLAACERHGFVKPVSQQIHYTAQARESEYELMPAAVDSGLGTMIWSPLAGGLLSGKYRRGADPLDGTRFAAGWKEPPIYDTSRLFDVVEALVAVAEDHGVSAARVALAWILTRPGVTTAIIGARRASQLDDNLEAADLTLTDVEIARIEKAGRPALIYPYWHQHMIVRDRFGSSDQVLHANFDRQ